MKKKIIAVVCALTVFTVCLIVIVNKARNKNEMKNKREGGEKRLLDIRTEMSKGELRNALIMSEELLRRYADDPQICLYLAQYSLTFSLLDDVRPELSTEVKRLKAKQDKTVLDLVKLAKVSDYYVNPEYLTLILQKYPGSIWAQWAELILGLDKFRKIQRPLNEQNLVDLCEYIESFMLKYPDSHLMPYCMSHYAFGRWDERINKDDEEAKHEAVNMLKRILVEYPEAEFYCTEARLQLRNILGESYHYPEGYSEENDRIVRKYYRPGQHYKEYTAKYKKIKEKSNSS